MSRNLGVGRLLGLMLLGAVGALPVALFGQDAASPEGGSQTPGRIDRGIAREDIAQPQGGSQTPGRVDRSQLTQPDLRADAADPNTGKPIDPRIEALLEVWSKRTKEIKRLQGTPYPLDARFQLGHRDRGRGEVLRRDAGQGAD